MVSAETVPAQYAPFHRALTELPEPGQAQARVVFRGAAKTTLTRAMVLHAVRYRTVDAIVVVRATAADCKSDAIAYEALAPLAGMVCETRLADQMILLDGVPVWLKSPKGRVRGLNYTYPDGRTVRPGLIIIDDIEDEESARSATQTQHLSDFVFRSLLPTAGQGLPPRVVMLGTPISPSTLVAKAMRQEPPFDSWLAPLVVPIVDGEGAPAWPDLFDPNLASSLPDDVYATEYLLQPLPLGSLVFPPDRTHWVDVQPGRHVVWVGVDPAGEGADATGIVAAALTEYGLYIVDALNYTGHAENMPETVGRFVRTLQTAGWKVGGVNVESTGLSTFATPLIRAQVAPVSVVTETPRLSKLERAMPLTLWQREGRLAFAPKLRGTPIDVEVHSWTREGQTVTGHDDMPDAMVWACGLATRGYTVQMPTRRWSDLTD